jgi:GT2 family glycosyltransferase
VTSVSAVIVGWNAGDALASCVQSLRESARGAAIDLQLVVVDNASHDGSVERLPLGGSDVRVRNAVNAGFSVAAAQGIARAGGDWILLVNPDLVVAPDFFSQLRNELARAADRVATLVPELRFASDPDLVNCRGLTVDEIGVPAEVDAGASATEPAVSTERILGGSSGCCLLRADALRVLGGPEPAFFAYLEDADLALRLRRAGYETVFAPRAVALHEGSASTGGRSRVKAFLVARNRRLLFRLHGPRSPRARVLRSVVELGHGTVTSLRGGGAAPWRGRFEALRLRRYARFVTRSRAEHEPRATSPGSALAPRATLRDTLRRKRAVDRATERD